MHLLTLTEPVDLRGRDNWTLPGQYLLEDTAAAHLLVIADGGTMIPLLERRPFDAAQDWNGKKILLMRAGGYGDLTLMTPIPREIKRRWPAAHVALCAMDDYTVVVQGLPFIDEILPYPLPKNKADEFDAWVFYESAIERNPRARELHMTDLFAEMAGLGEVPNKLPAYRITDDEIDWALQNFPRTPGMSRVCIQAAASAVCRTFPQEELSRLSSLLVAQGWEVFLFGPGGDLQMAQARDNRIWLCKAPRLAFRQSCALVHGSNVFVGVDSALLHVAGALAVPAVGLYGPFPWKLRTAYCPTTFSLQGEGKCSPCFHHVNMAKKNNFPANCPSASTGRCEVLGSIKAERIVAKVRQMEGRA